MFPRQLYSTTVLQLVGLSYECVLDVRLELLQDSLVVEETMIYTTLN